MEAATLAQPAERSVARSRRPRGELIAYAVLVLVAIALRFYELGDRPFHHDESQDAYFSWIFYKNGDYVYQPLLHGPLRFYLTAGMYELFGASNFTARLAPALMGIVMVPLPYLLRDQLGRLAAFTTAVLLAVGPSFLYFSRFAREDIYFASITAMLLVAVFRFLHAPRRHHPAIIGALLALSFATKETTFITVFVAGTFFLAVLATRHRHLLLDPIRSVGLDSWGWAVAAFVGIFTVLFTTFLTHPGGLWDGIYTGLKYWLSQHGVRRGGESDVFYAVVLAGIEWPALLLGAVGAVVALRRPTLLRVFLVWDFVLSLAVYSWAGEKFAWLVLHPLLPLLFLAGIGVQTIWESRGTWAGKLALAATAVALLYVGYASFLVNAVHRADPRELLVSTQSSEQVAKVADDVLSQAERADREGRPFSVTIDAADGATFPYAWYFRDLNAGYVDLSKAGAAPKSDVLILTQASYDRLRDQLGDYTAREFPFRVWWVREYGKLTPAAYWRYITGRKVWNPTGGMPEWLVVAR